MRHCLLAFNSVLTERPCVPSPPLQTRLDLSGRSAEYVVNLLAQLMQNTNSPVASQCVFFAAARLSPALTSVPSVLGALGALQELDLSNNELTRLEGLDRLTELAVLRVDFNAIKQVEGLEGCRKLRHLSISNNQVRSCFPPPPDSANYTLRFIHSLFRVCDDHQLSSVRNLTHLRTLEVLDLSNNSIPTVDALRALTVNSRYTACPQ